MRLKFRSRAHAPASLLAIAGTLLGAPAFAQQSTDLKPNIRALPAGDFSVVADLATGRPELRFSATTRNSGAGPLELVAGETGAGNQNVYQRVFRTDGTYTDRLAGSFVWHPAHNHFHFEDFAVYSLQPVNAPGSSARTSAKTTFCVMDTHKVDAGLAGAPRKPVYADCGAQLQGMSVGWGDKYGAHLPGQEIDLSDWPDGSYKLTIVADPKDQLVETDESDNSACIVVSISVTAMTASPAAVGCNDSGAGVITVAGITPNSAATGSTVAVTITGSGFAPGIAVSFEQGSGARPVASSVVVQSASTLTALVTVKKGKAGTDPVWDLRVGTGILRDAFAVHP